MDKELFERMRPLIVGNVLAAFLWGLCTSSAFGVIFMAVWLATGSVVISRVGQAERKEAGMEVAAVVGGIGLLAMALGWAIRKVV